MLREFVNDEGELIRVTHEESEECSAKEEGLEDFTAGYTSVSGTSIRIDPLAGSGYTLPGGGGGAYPPFAASPSPGYVVPPTSGRLTVSTGTTPYSFPPKYEVVDLPTFFPKKILLGFFKDADIETSAYPDWAAYLEPVSTEFRASENPEEAEMIVVLKLRKHFAQ